MKINIKTKMVAAIMAIIILFGTLATYSVFWFTKNNIIEINKENLNKQIKTQEYTISQVFNLGSKIALAIAENPNVLAIIQQTNITEDDREHLEGHVLETVNIGGMYSAIYVMNTEGLTLASTDSSFVGKNYKFREYFQKAKDGIPWVDVSVGVTSRELGYYFANPVKNRNNEIVGVAVVKMKPLLLARTFENLNYKDDVDIMLVDKYGIITHSKENKQRFHSLGFINESVMRSVEESKRYSGVQIVQGEYTELQDLIGTIPEGESEIFQTDSKNGGVEYAVLGNIKGYPFYVLVKMNIEDFMSDSISVSKTIALLVAIAAVMSGFAIYIMISKLLRPLIKLREEAERVSKGDLSKITINSEDEIGVLVGTLNDMIDSINKKNDEVRNTVAEQTEVIKRQQAETESAKKRAERMVENMAGRELKMIELKKEISKLKQENDGNQ